MVADFVFGIYVDKMRRSCKPIDTSYLKDKVCNRRSDVIDVPSEV
jgi:hypothetical protein